MYYAVGGINANASFGLGVWNFMVWMVDENGADIDDALYGNASFLLMAVTG